MWPLPLTPILAIIVELLLMGAIFCFTGAWELTSGHTKDRITDAVWWLLWRAFIFGIVLVLVLI